MRAAEKWPSRQLVTVFEAVNETRKEIFVGVSDLLIDQLERAFQSSPPKSVQHWTSDDRILFRSIEYSVAAKETDDFIDAYLRNDALKGWKTFRGERWSR